MLKKLLCFFLTIGSSLFLFAQDCETLPSATIDLAVNGVSARLTTGGDLWWDGQEGKYHVSLSEEYLGDTTLSAIFAGGLWMAGRDSDGVIKVSAQQYGRNVERFDYLPGPLRTDGLAFGNCTDWDRFFVANQEEIQEYLSDYDPDTPGSIPIPDRIAGWPATGNPFFEEIHGFSLPEAPHPMAPFWDEDADGIYDPRKGDFPLIAGEEAIWCVFNDAVFGVNRDSYSTPILAEVHLMAYATVSEDSDLHRTTFYDYSIYNRGQADIVDFYAGHWIDTNLGCRFDDLPGSIPAQNLFYIYDSKKTDSNFCNPDTIPTNGPSPVNIYQVVNTNIDEVSNIEDPLMHSMISPILPLFDGLPALRLPSRPEEYYHVLQGRWADGQPISRGGIGYHEQSDTTLFAFDGGLHDSVPWLSCNWGYPINFSDFYQEIYSTGPYYLKPGEVAQFTLAVTTTSDMVFPDAVCPDREAIRTVGSKIKTFYDENMSTSVLTSTFDQPVTRSLDLRIFPNPTSGEITFELPMKRRIKEIEVLDFFGRVHRTIRAVGNRTTFDLNLPAGTYVYRVTTGEGEILTGKLIAGARGHH